MLLYALLAIGIFLMTRQMYFGGLDRDRNQHHLASLLCAVAASQPGHDRKEISTHLAAIARNGVERKLRLTHAVRLARGNVPPDLHPLIQALAKEL
ncbi:MAG: hypothetical protein H6916_02920 [Novosphingobium sp.]|uniref:hypothetical protein n=1 Tax=Novosphingobium sp. TaxID=1874826 RepID=UPI001D617720|nr:hypothetical protein [Novosphingobium sp.]MCB2057561.1 hypothetical protein [Novosphingobium sp.]MCP5385754.1 hypothetical protein [Novosphingobium sp.]